ncbi:TD and POZ domain-containing protein 1-like isoform X1 [Planococcus citri]|uniref:TD and POZ domain-containing protein 1-like isoform X1 n=1 Tax=Planococcus citri TaxID=170843 RepID=UPI0031F77C8B
MVYKKYFSKFFESIMPRRKKKQPNPKSDCLPTEIHHQTTSQVHKVNFTWTIDELDFHITKKEFLKSCKFSAITNEEREWRLVCLPYTDTLYKSDDHLMSIFLNLCFVQARTHVKVAGKRDICFLNSQQKELYRTTIPICQLDSNWSYSTTFRIKKKHILPGNKLTIRFNLTYINMDDSIFSNKNNAPTSTAAAPAAPHQRQIPKSEQSEKVALLDREDKLEDVVISDRGKIYLAHKATLVACSPVFAYIIKAKEKKGKITQIKIPEVNAEVFGEMLTYINTGKLFVDNATDLFKLAKGFHIRELEIKLINYMDQKYGWRTGE